MTPDLGRALFIARWQPPHLAHARTLRALLPRCDRLIVGIGSSNLRDARNPLSVAERVALLELILPGPGWSPLAIPDLGDPPRWGRMILEATGPVDTVITAKPEVHRVFEGSSRIRHPASLLEPADRTPVTGSEVRLAWARRRRR
jgi:nicotinamide mononucleotide adenylyltransferase